MKMQKKNKRFLDGKDLKGTPWISKNKSDEIQEDHSFEGLKKIKL